MGRASLGCRPPFGLALRPTALPALHPRAPLSPALHPPDHLSQAGLCATPYSQASPSTALTCASREGRGRRG